MTREFSCTTKIVISPCRIQMYLRRFLRHSVVKSWCSAIHAIRKVKRMCIFVW